MHHVQGHAAEQAVCADIRVGLCGDIDDQSGHNNIRISFGRVVTTSSQSHVDLLAARDTIVALF